MKTSIGALFMFLWLQLDWVSHGEKVDQHHSILSVQEGNKAVISCSYSDSGSDYFPWYKQEPGKGPQFITYIRSTMDKNPAGRFTVFLNKTAKHFSLHIAGTQPGDSAIYFCAASRGSTLGKLSFGRGTQLTVRPDIKNPDPAVYQLRSPKSSNTSVCLFTDFDSKITNVTQEPGVFGSSSTALDMKAVGSKSNGALRWSASSYFSCESTFNGSFYSSSEIPCDATLIEKSFETDMNLNFQNLSVIGLRILFLKVAGFNLLMTLRLWSS